MGKLAALKEQYFPSDASYSMRDQLGYCGGIFGNSMAQDITTSFADVFARDYMKIEPKKITLFDNIAIFLGFLSGALSGYILDTPVKADKKSPAKRITALFPLPIAITSVMLFVVPSVHPSMNFIWKLVFHLIFNVTDSFYDASLNTMSLRVAADARDRKVFFTVGTFAAALGSMLPGWIVPILVQRAKNPEVEKKIYFFSTLIFSIIGFFTMLTPSFTMHEVIRPTERPEKEKLVWDKQTVMSILHNRTFIITEVGSLFEQVRQTSYKFLNYFYKDVLFTFDLGAPMGALSGALSYAGLLAVPYLNKRFSTRTIISGGFAYTGLFFTLIGLLGRNRSIEKMRRIKLLFGLLIGFSGMPNQAIAASKRIMVGDATDYMEWYAEKTYGKPIHAEGFITSIQSILGNVFNMICTNMYDFSFHKLNYNAQVIKAAGAKPEKTAATLHGIFRLFVLFGVVGNFLAAATFLFENYNGKRKDEITAELAGMRKRRQLVEDAQADVEKV